MLKAHGEEVREAYKRLGQPMGRSKLEPVLKKARPPLEDHAAIEPEPGIEDGGRAPVGWESLDLIENSCDAIAVTGSRNKQLVRIDEKHPLAVTELLEEVDRVLESLDLRPDAAAGLALDEDDL